MNSILSNRSCLNLFRRNPHVSIRLENQEQSSQICFTGMKQEWNQRRTHPKPGNENGTSDSYPFSDLSTMTRTTPPASTDQPSRKLLAKDLAEWEDNPLVATPDRIGLQAVSVQNHARDLQKYFSSTDDMPTPVTNSLMNACHTFEKVGPNAVVDRQSVLVRMGNMYSGRSLFSQNESCKKPSETNTSRSSRKKTSDDKHLDEELRDHQSLFGGSVPSNSEAKRRKQSMYDSSDICAHRSISKCIVSVPGLGPNAKKQKTEITFNGFRVIHFVCAHSHQKDLCDFRARIFFPHYLDDKEEVMSSAPVISPKGIVASQVGAEHTCSSLVDWRDHLLGNKRGKLGLHPLLKECVAQMLGSFNRFYLPKPDEMFGLISKKFGDETDELFPSDCLPIVRQQIREYWSKERSKLFQTEHTDMVKYLDDMPKFRRKHSIQFSPPPRRVSMSTISTREGIRQYAKDILDSGPTKTLVDPSLETKTRLYEHEMFVLPLPSESDLLAHQDLADLFAEARNLDNTDDGRAEKHTICFSCINLLLQTFVVAEYFDFEVMACTDSSHNCDSGGGKLFSFGYVTMAQVHQTRHEYRRTYTPIVFARIIEESEAATIFVLCCLKFVVRKLFNVDIDVKNGLISDHTAAFTNAWKKLFPGRPMGQCFPHFARKVKDQSGRRKNGSPGYLKYVVRRTYLKEAHTDVVRSGRSRTQPMQDTYRILKIAAWKHAGESALADVCQKSYIENDDFSHYRFNEFGIPGDLPQGNSTERLHLSAKGTRDFAGYMNFGKSVDTTLHYEFPKLVYNVSFRIQNIRRCYKILDKKACDGDRQLRHDVSMLTDDDWKECGKEHTGEWYSNDVAFIGYELSEERISRYHMALLGRFPSMDHSKRSEFWEAGTSLCTVKKARVPSVAHPIWTCTCFTFWEQTVCAHVYYRQYGGSPSISMQPASKKSRISLKQMSKRYKWKSGFEESDDDDGDRDDQREKDSSQSFVFIAPPGKLGVLITASGDGMPTITGVSDTSSLKGTLKMGDQLSSVDGEDCTGLSNREVSDLIARGVAQPSRCLEVVRKIGP
jgi:hypothetical protein